MLNGTDDQMTRHDWTVGDILAIHDLPLLELISRANAVHRAHKNVCDVQKASLLSIKTGHCPEDCSYCPQSAHHAGVDLDAIDLMRTEDVLARARAARAAGRIVSAWARLGGRCANGPEFDAVLDMVRGVRALGMEACVTLGMLDENQARRLKDAGPHRL